MDGDAFRRRTRVMRPLRRLGGLARLLGVRWRHRENRVSPGESFYARVDLPDGLPVLPTGQVAEVLVEVTNLSGQAWPSRGQRGAALRYRITEGDGGAVLAAGAPVPLPRPVPSGARLRVPCPVRAPKTPGRYVCEIAVVPAGGSPATDAGAPPLRMPCHVRARRPEEFGPLDYEQAWREVDLTKDHWSIVGPGSAEEFRQLGKAKLAILTGLGLHPGSRVLDVGCGTGCLTEALAGFLSDDGGYCGTDITDVAVEYCRKRFDRPNFRFQRSGMVTLPLAGVEFDFVTFFSVFTHTFPDETLALLREAKRLLAERGSIVADAFEAELSEDSIGTRAMVVLPTGRLASLARAAGLDMEAVQRFTWDGSDDRRIERVVGRFTVPRSPLAATLGPA